MMGEDNPLQRAHVLSARATSLLPSTSVHTLTQALSAYQQACALFTLAEANEGDQGARRTLGLLVQQHKKLVKDTERKLAFAKAGDNAVSTSPAARPAAAAAAAAGTEPGAGPGIGRRVTSPLPAGGGEGMSLGLASLGTKAWPPPGVTTRLSPGIPPFALRPAPPSSHTQAGPGPGASSSFFSPLNSASSSSSVEADTSYLNLGAIPDALDPFSRFWGALENMLEEVSNPVKFASVPLAKNPASEEQEQRTRKGKEKEQDTGDGSFYVIRKRSANDVKDEKPARNASPLSKTLEELVLENTNLRTSLDAIASHAQSMEATNKALKEQIDERERLMKSVVVGVRREAHKAKVGQEMLRSQLLTSTQSPPRVANPTLKSGPSAEGLAATAGLRQRIKELEDEIKSLKADNEKQKASATKYKDRLDKIKENAKTKRDARLHPKHPDTEGKA